MISMEKAPEEFNGKPKVFEEVFYSPFEKDTAEDALRVLDEIRETHDAEHGWVEFHAYIDELPNGKYRAVRHHAKYK